MRLGTVDAPIGGKRRSFGSIESRRREVNVYTASQPDMTKQERQAKTLVFLIVCVVAVAAALAIVLYGTPLTVVLPIG